MYVIDANILFSGVISARPFYLDIFQPKTSFAPDYALLEVAQYSAVILAKTKLNEAVLRKFTIALFQRLTIVPDFAVSSKSKLTAFELCQSIDPKDTPYVALAIELDSVLLTRDKALVAGLKGKGFEHVQRFDDFLDSIRNMPGK